MSQVRAFGMPGAAKRRLRGMAREKGKADHRGSGGASGMASILFFTPYIDH